jgi:hypothetical protein
MLMLVPAALMTVFCCQNRGPTLQNALQRVLWELLLRGVRLQHNRYDTNELESSP